MQEEFAIHFLKDSEVIIWTTTPWTIPANKALAYNKSLEYSVIEINSVAENFDIFHIKLCVPPTRLTIITLKMAFEGVLFINVKKCDLWFSSTL